MCAISIVAELDRRFGIPGIATVCEGNGGLPRVHITGPLAEGEMYLHGAHVTSWKPAGHDEMLFVSTKSRWEEGQAIRGGIPICFPWFRAKVDDPHAPAHGFLRTKMWQLESIVENKDGVAVSMFSGSDDQTRRWWPGEFRVEHRVLFGSELSLELVCTNTGTIPIRFEEALHTYNRVADVQDARLTGAGCRVFLDNTDSNKEKTQSGDVAIASPTDSAYVNTPNAVDLIDPTMRRRIRLRKINSLTTVVWNPWAEAAAKMRDLGDGEWSSFSVSKRATSWALRSAWRQGQVHKMTAALSVTKL